ncbi:MAG: caspase family protein [Bacteroidales bacterium]|nr:caspase family protein [Bacteroidales bacterium]
MNESDVIFARNDAKIFKEYAIKTLGVPADNVTLLTDATAGEMSQNINLISKIISKIDSAELIFYYAGHGLPDEITNIPYLIPVDVNGTDLSSAIKLSDVYKQFSECSAKRVTIFLDACFSGGSRETGLLAQRGVKIKPNKEVLSGNLVVFTASSEKQSALPYNNEKHGMFTYFLLKKLKETKADITYDELSKYVKTNVSINSLKVNRTEQDPKVNISNDIKEIWKGWKMK